MGICCVSQGTQQDCVYLWLSHVEVWQKTTKFCKAIIFQLKYKWIKKTHKEVENSFRAFRSQSLWGPLVCIILEVWYACLTASASALREPQSILLVLCFLHLYFHPQLQLQDPAISITRPQYHFLYELADWLILYLVVAWWFEDRV